MITGKKQLTQGLNALHLSVDPHQIDLLYQYLILLHHWNQTYNLTGIRHLSEMISMHILDSLIITPHLTGHQFLDVGSGAGLPGIPLAILHPENHYTLLDSNGKKARFLRQVIRQLALTNVTVAETRSESFDPHHTFNGILSRGLGTLTYMIDITQHLLSTNGHWFAMKGLFPEQEIQQVTQHYPAIHIQNLILLKTENKTHRHLVIMHC
ncbi:MAG: 16S rRNA (guanine(527)-N(7))-methyltransferase RsmG [Endozoicomonadaceae bacterium]|nr:16S rRNA (guanine(527)-N(7))-methyltransferase RsmG [Endozoicomonadaceae bacterium]